MAFQNEHLAAEGREAFGDREAIGAGFEDEDILGGGVPRAERFQRLPGDALEGAGAQRIAPLEDGAGPARR